MSEKTAVTKVNAKFETLAKFENVLLRCPGLNDKHFKLIPAHSISVDGATIAIKAHYRRGDFIDGKMITKHFFVDNSHFNNNIVATVEVIKKTDLSKNGETTLLLNITPNTSTVRPTWRLKVGTDKKLENNSFPIPDTKKFINLEPIS